MAPPKIRQEMSSDHERIREVTELAFRDMPYADGDEQDVIDRLRRVDALTLSLIAEIEGNLVGHIAFSPVDAGDDSSPWFALGPVSVLPEHQDKGIGTTLIETGLTHIANLGALGCILTGNPKYYRKFRFELAPQHTPANESPEFFMLRLLQPVQPKGLFSFHKAFYGDD